MSKKEAEYEHPEKKMFWVAGVSIIIMFVVPGVFALTFGALDWGGPSDWATFANYFSGLVTPVVALGSVLLFFRSIIVQRNELRDTRAEMKTANQIQLDIEHKRFNQRTQEQLERAIPVVRELHKKLFSNIKKWINETQDKPEQGMERVKDYLHWYCEKSIHIASMVNAYLDADGDIYLTFEWINALGAEQKAVEKYVEMHSLTADSQFLTYSGVVNELLNRRTAEVARYDKKWVCSVR